MANDPAYLFYDADAAKDVAHMDRLERGAYFDILQAQRKFGPMALDVLQRILGKDFQACWPNIELILKKEDEKYFIDWAYESSLKRKKYVDSRTKNRMGGKAETPPPPPPDKDKKAAKAKGGRKKIAPHIFPASDLFDKEKFIAAFKDTDYKYFDTAYYYERVKNWAGATHERADWMATARNFMLGDYRDGKAKYAAGIKPVNEAIEGLMQKVDKLSPEYINSL